MRYAAPIFSALISAVLVAPAWASSGYATPVAHPPIRYSAELAPGQQGTPPSPSQMQAGRSGAAQPDWTVPSPEAPAPQAPSTRMAAAAKPDATPPLRYSVEIPPGDAGTPGEPGYKPQPEPDFTKPKGHVATRDAHPPLRYSVESEGPGPLAPQPPASPTPPTSSQAAPSAPPGPDYSIEDLSPTPAHASANASRPTVPAAPSQHAGLARSEPGYRLGTGDKVHVTVYGESDLTGDFEVAGNGHIAFPLIGEVRASGLTAPQLANELTQKLSNGYLRSPRVAVEITTYRPFYVVGQVNRPGRYAYFDGMTAMNAIAMAGGYTQWASEGDVYVRHEGQTREIELPANDTTAIKPGDVVRVEESPFWSVMNVLTPLAGVAGTARYGLP